jgi:predicted histone-like DNA-binding protein
MIKYRLYQNQNKSNTTTYKKWYAYPVVEQTLSLTELAEHMSEHNTAYSSGIIAGIMTDMVSCIKELVLNGKHVKIDNLAIFYPSIENAKGCSDQADYKVSEYVKAVHLSTRATGAFSKSQLNLDKELVHDPLDTFEGTEEDNTDEPLIGQVEDDLKIIEG